MDAVLARGGGRNGLKPCPRLAPSEVGGALRGPALGSRIAAAVGGSWGGGGPGPPRQRLAQSRGAERAPCPPPAALQQNGWALCLARSLELGSPSCHLPLQSISGSCMWVTQQHCSQAQEAAAEPKGSERCTPLLCPGGRVPARPPCLVCSESFQDFQVNQDFPRGRKPNSFSTTSKTENKAKTVGKLHPGASAAPERPEAQGQAGGWQSLSGVGSV